MCHRSHELARISLEISLQTPRKADVTRYDVCLAGACRLALPWPRLGLELDRDL